MDENVEEFPILSIEKAEDMAIEGEIEIWEWVVEQIEMGMPETMVIGMLEKVKAALLVEEED